MEEQIPRDSETLTEEYVQEDLEKFISVEKMKILEKDIHSLYVCSENQLHEGIRQKDGEFLSCVECGARVNLVKKVK